SWSDHKTGLATAWPEGLGSLVEPRLQLRPQVLHRRRARGMERVVRDVVDDAHDPRPVTTALRNSEVEHVGARRRLLERAEVGATTGERVREQDPVHAAVEHRERRLPLTRHELVEGRQHTVERLAERLATEEPRGLVAHL